MFDVLATPKNVLSSAGPHISLIAKFRTGNNADCTCVVQAPFKTSVTALSHRFSPNPSLSGLVQFRHSAYCYHDYDVACQLRLIPIQSSSERNPRPHLECNTAKK